jgi:uncharacterized protein YuzE
MEPYRDGLIPDHWVYGKIRDVLGRIVIVSGLFKSNRNLDLIFPKTRSIVKNEIVELSVTNDEGIGIGNIVDNLLYVGFFEVQVGGQIVVGESVFIKNENIGKVSGFSDIHYPNHLNIIVKSSDGWFKQILEGKPIKIFNKDSLVYSLNIDIEDEISFQMK